MGTSRIAKTISRFNHLLKPVPSMRDDDPIAKVVDMMLWKAVFYRCSKLRVEKADGGFRVDFYTNDHWEECMEMQLSEAEPSEAWEIFHAELSRRTKKNTQPQDTVNSFDFDTASVSFIYEGKGERNARYDELCQNPESFRIRVTHTYEEPNIIMFALKPLDSRIENF